MALPVIPLASILADATSVMETTGIDSTFTLREGLSFTVKASRATPSTLSQDLTAGLAQYPLKVIVLYADWHGAAGPDRRPQRGDLVLQLGMKYTIQAAQPLGIGTTVFGYTMQVLG